MSPGFRISSRGWVQLPDGCRVYAAKRKLDGIFCRESMMMKRKILLVSALFAAFAFSLPAGFARAADQAPGDANAQMPMHGQIYGSQMMTPQERSEHLAKLRAAKSAEEREQIRQAHHEQMKARAKARGVTLPDEPPAKGMGAGKGMGMGPGQAERPNR
jgi:hypothetical protein